MKSYTVYCMYIILNDLSFLSKTSALVCYRIREEEREEGEVAFPVIDMEKLNTVQVETCIVCEKNTWVSVSHVHVKKTMNNRWADKSRHWFLNRWITGEPINHVTDFPGGDHRPKRSFRLHSYCSNISHCNHNSRVQPERSTIKLPSIAVKIVGTRGSLGSREII